MHHFNLLFLLFKQGKLGSLVFSFAVGRIVLLTICTACTVSKAGIQQEQRKKRAQCKKQSKWNPFLHFPFPL